MILWKSEFSLCLLLLFYLFLLMSWKSNIIVSNFSIFRTWLFIKILLLHVRLKKVACLPVLVLASLCAFIKSGLYYLEVSWIWKWKVDYLCISTSCSLHCFIFTFCSSKIMQYRCQRNANKLLTYVPFRWCYDELVSEWTLWLPIRHSSLVNAYSTTSCFFWEMLYFI